MPARGDSATPCKGGTICPNTRPAERKTAPANEERKPIHDARTHGLNCMMNSIPSLPSLTYGIVGHPRPIPTSYLGQNVLATIHPDPVPRPIRIRPRVRRFDHESHRHGPDLSIGFLDLPGRDEIPLRVRCKHIPVITEYDPFDGILKSLP
jgi:hypothetical protein